MKKTLALLLTLIMVLCSGMTVLAAPVTMPDGGVFDAQFYAATYPDVAAVCGSNTNLLYQHYLMFGKAEGRLPYAPGTSASAPAAAASGAKTMPDGGLFDPVFYYNTYPDVAAAFGNNEALLYQHYLLSGKAEGRLPYAAAAPAKPAAAPAAAAAPALPPGYGPGVSVLHLDAGAQFACYRLLRADGSEAFRVFLSPGTSTVKSFPSGRYVLKTAHGSRWISDAQAFGSSGIYGKSDLYYFENGGEYEIVSSAVQGDFSRTTASGFLN